MKTEEFYRYRDTILNELEESFERFDNSRVEDIDKITHEVIYKANTWRSKNKLNRYTEANILEHSVYDLERQETITLDMGTNDESNKYDIFACIHTNCNYHELRLQEGHREDR